MRNALVMVATASLLRVCGQREPSVSVSVASAAPAMVPEHGGSVGASAGLVAEVSAQPDGKLVAYLRDAQGAPVTVHEVQLTVRRPDGQAVAVPVTYDETLHGYVGRPAGLPAGAWPVEVSVQTAPEAPMVHLVTAPVTVAAVASVPAPRHGGRVEVVGDHAVEVVAAPSGDVALYWMDLDGDPVPPAEVYAPTITVTVAGRPHTVPTRVDGDHLVAHVEAAPRASVAVALPLVVVRGRPFRRVMVAPAVVVAPPVGVVIGGHVPHGRDHGYWRNHGGVVVVPGGRWRGHGHGHGHGHDDD
jgi:hypothetical protein